MKYVLFAAIMILGLCGCVVKTQLDTSDTNNKNYEVDYLFEHEGCKVYRFYDVRDGYHHYFTNCTETMTIQNCGKGCRRQDNVRTN